MNEAHLQEAYQRALAARDDGTRASCVSLDAILAVARAEGSESERFATLSHVMSCRACQRELDLLRAIEAAGSPSGAAVAVRRETKSLPWKAIVPLALAASLLIAVGIGGPFWRGDSPDTPRGEAGALALVTPADQAEVAPGAPIDFAWRADAEARHYVLEVLTTTGDIVLSRTTPDTTLTVTDIARLAPGNDYRWWVRAITPDGQRTSAMGRLRVRSR